MPNQIVVDKMPVKSVDADKLHIVEISPPHKLRVTEVLGTFKRLLYLEK